MIDGSDSEPVLSGAGSSNRLAAFGAGLVTVVAGVALAVWPRVSLFAFSQIAGWVMWLAGFVLAFQLGRTGRVRSLAFLAAVGGAVLGLVLALWPDRTILVVTVAGGLWLVINGMARVFGTMSAASARAEVLGNVLGIGEALLGVVVIARPVAGVRAAAIVMGAGLVLHGLGRIRDGVAGESDAPRGSTDEPGRLG